MTRRNGGNGDYQSANQGLGAIAGCSECTCFNLRKAARVVTQAYDDRMRPAGLRATQFALLVHAYTMGPLALSRLAEAMVIDRTTLARNIELLEKSGLIEVRDGDDRRTRIVGITEEGRKKLSDALPLWKKTQEEIKKMMGEEEWSLMISKIALVVDEIRKR